MPTLIGGDGYSGPTLSWHCPHVLWSIDMDNELLMRGKYTFRAGDQKPVVVKKPVEHLRHVVMKVLLWALYLPTYPLLRVEVPIGYKYKPDFVALDAGGPLFWAEAGRSG